MPVILRLSYRLSPGLQDMLEGMLAPKEVRGVTANAINKTIRDTKSYIARELSEKSGIKRKDLNRRIFFGNATVKRLAGNVTTGSKAFPLILFGARQGPRGVTARVFGELHAYEHAFIRTGPKIGRQVWIRKQQPWISAKGNPALRLQQRKDLRIIEGVSVTEALKLAGMHEGPVQNFIAANLAEQVPRSIKYFIEKRKS